MLELSEDPVRRLLQQTSKMANELGADITLSKTERSIVYRLRNFFVVRVLRLENSYSGTTLSRTAVDPLQPYASPAEWNWRLSLN